MWIGPAPPIGFELNSHNFARISRIFRRNSTIQMLYTCRISKDAHRVRVILIASTTNHLTIPVPGNDSPAARRHPTPYPLPDSA